MNNLDKLTQLNRSRNIKRLANKHQTALEKAMAQIESFGK